MRLLVVTQDDPAERDAPGLGGRAREPQAAERDGEADDVAVGRHPTVRLPHRIEAVVVVLPLGDDAVELHAPGVGHEHVGVLAVVERVKIDSHSVVPADLLAPGDARPDLGGIVAAHEDDVEVLVIVRDVGRRLLADRCAVARLALAELGDAGAQPGVARAGVPGARPARVAVAPVEEQIQRWWLEDAGDAEQPLGLLRQRGGSLKHRGPKEHPGTSSKTSRPCRHRVP